MMRTIRNGWKHIPSVYRPGISYAIAAAACCSAAGGFVGWLFFEHILAVALLAGLSAGGLFPVTASFAERRKRLTAAQFEQLLFSLASSLQAGKSVENAFLAAELDLDRLYGEGSSVLMTELKRLNRMTEHGTPIERSVEHLRSRLALPEVDDWADMFHACRRTGGDLVKVMRQTSRAVIEKMNMERELSVLIAGKRFEALALSFIPFLIVCLFRYGSPEYMDALYSGQGRWVMAAALAMLAAGICAAARIMRVEV